MSTPRIPEGLKVINLGLPKSGTTSLGAALKHAGFKVADWRIRRGQSRENRLARAFVGKQMYLGYFRNGNPLSLIDEFNAFTEIDVVRDGLNFWPQCDWGLLTAIRKHNPGARFLLTYRDPAKLSDSMVRWSNLGSKRLPQNAIPGLPKGFGKTDAERIRWIEGHFAFCRQVFSGSDDFLEYDIEDHTAQDRLSEFLGVDLPWWGVANANENRPGAESDTAPSSNKENS
ncbi:sulfotransferase family protein [Aliiroseovarius sp. KMU-50]|uniref:Sulfotransferase family protein n=1 Tax=Aliiroseovarius salicola TaxID=3009082 RepID=A0ABT4W056_9RHOB|nr:sulfotransferase [Aliiroseovarius sp. KMU-50]MDA5093899.1 sulfotransferase family protein [Aliiroseovarius sp. KMU-50]